MTPNFPVYVVSKGRADHLITSKALSSLGINHYIVVEDAEREVYSRASQSLLSEVLVLPHGYKENYELCDDLGLSKSTGPGPARNFAWDHSLSKGFSWHWVMDDNIRSFRRLNFSARIKVSDGAIFKAMEFFVSKYSNIAMAGPNYTFFAFSGKTKPFTLNTRIYSCNLIRNDLPFRWRGRYNEDTIISLDMLKAGYCTVLFNAFLQEKMATQVLSGGNTTEFYSTEGTNPKSRMLAEVHSDVARISKRFNRDHHFVDYRRFQSTSLRRRGDIPVKYPANEFGMRLVLSENGEQVSHENIPRRR